MSANIRHNVYDVTTSCQHYDDNCTSLWFTLHKLSISENRHCRSHRCPADTNTQVHLILKQKTKWLNSFNIEEKQEKFLPKNGKGPQNMKLSCCMLILTTILLLWIVGLYVNTAVLLHVAESTGAFSIFKLY